MKSASPFAKFRSDVKTFSQNTLQQCSRSLIFFKIVILITFTDIHIKTSVLESLFNKVTRLMVCNFIKKRLLHKCFSVNITKCLRMAFFMEDLRWPLLKMVEKFLRISQLEKYLCRRIHKGERFVKMLCSK